jgi:stage III sporulation protein AH
MNTKRQTIWLVSMLSLMVVLSAYYLFTEDLDSGTLTETMETGQQEQLEGTAITVDEVVPGTGEVSGVDAEGLTAEDAEVLRQLEAQGTISVGGDYITKLQMSRSEQIAQETDRLLGIMSDLSNKPEDATTAAEELSALEEKADKLTGIEEQLQAAYPNVVVAEEKERFNVVVQSEKLESAQAVDIIDLVMKTMDVSADKVSVQYIP